MYKIQAGSDHALFNVASTRFIETELAQSLPDFALMERAGLAIAKLALALAPHQKTIWIACGPGNNGGDGIAAAIHLHRWGKKVFVTWLGKAEKCPAESQHVHQLAVESGVAFVDSIPENTDFCIDALLGIGADRPAAGQLKLLIDSLNQSGGTILAVDVPTGLNADTGVTLGSCVKANFTLSLLTLKPGLFTASGRDVSGEVWFEPLAQIPEAFSKLASFRLLVHPIAKQRLHDTHKGSYGDVVVIGGTRGMVGAAFLAASAALHSGAGRVFVGMMDPAAISFGMEFPELMFRDIDPKLYTHKTVVCGCGAGVEMVNYLEDILLANAHVVIDADAINCIANSSRLQSLLLYRAGPHWATVMTPHPLEAARLLSCSVQTVQNNRLVAAQNLAERFNCTVALKGSGTIVTSSGHKPAINLTGNPWLATPGSGDVLAGMVGAALANGHSAFEAACHAVYKHGAIADHWPVGQPLTAGQLAKCL